MKLNKKIIAASIGLAMVFGGAGVASAQTSTSTLSDLVAQIQNLLQQVKSLQDQIATLNQQRGELQTQVQSTLSLVRSLSQGMSGDDVTELQELLATDPDLYPEKLVTGYFGPLTDKAVKKFQKKYGIEQIGIVGPKTRAALHAFWNNLSASSTVSLPPGLAKKAQNSYSWSYGTTTQYQYAGGGKVLVCHKGHTISISVNALQAHLNHGDSVATCGAVVSDDDDDDEGDDNGDDNTDITAPVVSNLSVSNIATTSATISWNTNENTTAVLWYSTTTPVATSTAETMSQSSLSQSHSFDLDDLATSTTYHYTTSSSDLSGNTTETSESSFSTLSE